MSFIEIQSGSFMFWSIFDLWEVKVKVEIMLCGRFQWFCTLVNLFQEFYCLNPSTMSGQLLFMIGITMELLERLFSNGLVFTVLHLWFGIKFGNFENLEISKFFVVEAVLVSESLWFMFEMLFVKVSMCVELFCERVYLVFTLGHCE